MSDIVIGGWSDTWRTDLGYASVRSPGIRPPPQTISFTYRKAEISLVSGTNTFLICALRSADFVTWCLYSERNLTHNLFFLFPIVFIVNGVYSLKWRLTDRYLRWGTLAGPRPGRADADQCKSSDFLQELRISGFPRFWVSPTCFPAMAK